MKQREFIIILVPLFTLTILWVLFNIYHGFVTSTIKDPLTFQIIPIEGKFDTQEVNRLKQRQRINPLYEISSQVSPSPTPSEEKTTKLEGAVEVATQSSVVGE